MSVDLSIKSLVPIDKPHPPLNINCVYNETGTLRKLPIIQKKFKRSNFIGISIALNNVNWNELFSNVSIDTAIEQFYNVLYTILDKLVPVYKIPKYKFPLWFDHNLRNLINEKRLAHKYYKLNTSRLTYSNFSEK